MIFSYEKLLLYMIRWWYATRRTARSLALRGITRKSRKVYKMFEDVNLT